MPEIQYIIQLRDYASYKLEWVAMTPALRNLVYVPGTLVKIRDLALPTKHEIAQLEKDHKKWNSATEKSR